MRLLRKILPSWTNLLLAILAAVLLVLAFPDFEFWFLAWFALVPLMWAIERETKMQRPARSKGSDEVPRTPLARCFVIGWIFGTLFFFGTCWWLAYAPIHYAGFPPILAYSLVLIACLGAGIFPAIFAAILAFLLKRLGPWAFLAAPFVWVFTEFLRYWLTGNNWNAIGYSQAFRPTIISIAATGGVLLLSFAVTALAGFVLLLLSKKTKGQVIVHLSILVGLLCVFVGHELWNLAMISHGKPGITTIIAIQPNVPMSGVDSQRLDKLRDQQFAVSEREVSKVDIKRISFDRTVIERTNPVIVILPESPMNFMYNDDPEFQKFVGDFARRTNVSVLFNSAEPDPTNKKYFNSAVMVGPDGKPVAQYDKVYLLPFGEAVPPPLDGILPGFVGNFSYGREYDILPVGDAKAGVMICFENHFGQLSREYVRNGADVIIEMTNDGYLGPTPVLRQHLANAVFRAVETNRPVLRVTNVGITAYITEKGTVLDPAPVYQEDTRVWTVSKSDGSQTFYVRYGDWFAWLCSVVTIGLLIFGIATRTRSRELQIEVANGDEH